MAARSVVVQLAAVVRATAWPAVAGVAEATLVGVGQVVAETEVAALVEVARDAGREDGEVPVAVAWAAVETEMVALVMAEPEEAATAVAWSAVVAEVAVGLAAEEMEVEVPAAAATELVPQVVEASELALAALVAKEAATMVASTDSRCCTTQAPIPDHRWRSNRTCSSQAPRRSRTGSQPYTVREHWPRSDLASRRRTCLRQAVHHTWTPSTPESHHRTSP